MDAAVTASAGIAFDSRLSWYSFQSTCSIRTKVGRKNRGEDYLWIPAVGRMNENMDDRKSNAGYGGLAASGGTVSGIFLHVKRKCSERNCSRIVDKLVYWW